MEREKKYTMIKKTKCNHWAFIVAGARDNEFPYRTRAHTILYYYYNILIIMYKMGVVY